MRKPRILLCSESSLVKSGYGRITAELLKRLHSTGKYDVAEFASYMQPLDLLQQRDPLGFNLIQQNPWSAFPVEPYDDERSHFQSNLANQFGGWRFEDVCLDFKPDIVIDVRDVWFFSYLFKSPFRPFYNLSILPAVDGAPQLEEWVDLYSQANNVFTYTDWAAKLLGEHGIRNVECNSPGADLNTFRPMGKANIYGGIAGNNDIFIIGTVQRNQKRKLFPDLFEAFAEFISYCREKGNNKLADKTYLYCHTAYPDLGWDIPRLIKDSPVGHKILFTYICKNPQCNTAFPSLFSDARTICPRCQKFDATMPNTKFGVNEETLAGIISTFDLYVQYSTCLGENEDVLTEFGWKPIKEIVKGDKVYTNGGSIQSVTDKFENKLNGIIKKIYLKNTYDKILCTEDHQFLALTKNEICNGKECRSLKEQLSYRQLKNKKILEPKYYSLKELSSKDFLVSYIDNSTKDILSIDLANYLNNEAIIEDNKIFVKHGNLYNRYIMVDEKFCKFLGLFVANGSAPQNCTAIQVCNHINKIEAHELCYDTMGRFGNVKFCDNENKHNRTYYISSRLYGKCFRELCYTNKDKSLPNWVMTLPLNKQLKIVEGMFLGDGCYYKIRDESSFSTTSKILADQLQILLSRLKVLYSCSHTRRGKNKGILRKDGYNFITRKCVKDGELKTNGKSSVIYIDNYKLIPILKIMEEEYDGNVFTLEVENNHNYITRVGISKNCEGLGIPVIEAAGCSVPVAVVNYSGMEDLVKKLKAIPIKVERFTTEVETGRKFALPSNQDFVAQVYKFLELPEAIRKKRGFDARKGAEKHFNYDKFADKWAKHIDTIPVLDHSQTWNSPPRLYEPNMAALQQIAGNISNADFVEIACHYIMGPHQHTVGNYTRSFWLRQLNWGMQMISPGAHMMHEMTFLGDIAGMPAMQPFTRQNVVDELKSRIDTINLWEKRRCGLEQYVKPRFLVNGTKREKA